MTLADLCFLSLDYSLTATLHRLIYTRTRARTLKLSKYQTFIWYFPEFFFIICRPTSIYIYKVTSHFLLLYPYSYSINSLIAFYLESPASRTNDRTSSVTSYAPRETIIRQLYSLIPLRFQFLSLVNDRMLRVETHPGSCMFYNIYICMYNEIVHLFTFPTFFFFLRVKLRPLPKRSCELKRGYFCKDDSYIAV